MKKRLLYIIILSIASSFQLSAQYKLEWNEQTSGTSNVLKSVFFVDTSTGWAVGNSGEIIHTTDGGKAWNSQTSGVTTHLNSVFFVNKNLGWVVGEKSGTEPTILKTTNGGQNWVPQSIGITWNKDLIDVHFISEKEGWAISSDSILITEDGGDSWQFEKITGNTNYVFSALECTETGLGWIVGRNGSTEGIILHRFTDDPNNIYWYKVKYFADELFQKVFFLDDTTGWAKSGYSVARKTVPDVYTWTLSDAGEKTVDFTFFDKLNGLLFAEEGYVHISSDGGENWEKQDTVNTGYTSMNDLVAVNDSNIWVVGPGGTIFKATNEEPEAPPTGFDELDEINSQKNYRLNFVNNNIGRSMMLELSIFNNSSQVNLSIYTINGQKIVQLESNTLTPGTYKYDITNSSLTNGVYFLKLVINGEVESKKFLKQ